MKLIVGLGNPGKQYENTRHNIGFRVVDALVTSNKAKVTRSPDEKLVTCYRLPRTQTILAKTLTFMNNSGVAVKKLIGNWKLEIGNLVVIHDDLDIPLGQFRIHFGRGPKDHKGIQSVEETLGTNQFWRVRVGIDNRAPDSRIPGEEYVLQEFTTEERRKIEEVLKNVASEVIRHARQN